MFDYKTMLDVLADREAQSDRGFTFLGYDETPSFWSFQRIADEASRRASYLHSLGLEPGDRVALMLADIEQFVLTFIGAMRAGVVPIPMYPLFRPHPQHLTTAVGILRSARPRAVIADPAPEPLLQAIRELPIAHVLNAKDVANGARETADCRIETPDIHPDDTCFIQFTSGSTASPKGVIVTHANLLANGYAIMHHGIACDPEVDIGVCWLPLFHDMGLIGHVLAPLMVGAAVVFIPSLAFLTRPGIWMESVHKYRGTTIFGPNFSLALAARRTKNIEALDLGCLRIVGCGAEPIQPKTLHAFAETFAVAGLRREAIMPCYGLAEATLAVTVDSTTRPVRTVAIDRVAYEKDSVRLTTTDADPTALELVSCGRPLGEHRVTILDSSGAERPEGAVGEIAVQGPSVTRAYVGSDGSTNSASGWLLTGDLGFMLEGELFVSGRKKDTLIVDGKNYYPQTLEWLVDELPGVRSGAVVAFSVAGVDTESVVIIAEKTTRADAGQLARDIRQKLRQGIGLTASDVLLVEAGALPKTSSGKLQRQLAKRLYTQRAFSVQRSID